MEGQKLYILTKDRAPETLLLARRHTHRKSLLWYDEDKKVNRPLRYATNQISIFEDEQDGHATLGLIEFKDGSLSANERRDATLIRFLEHHPDNVANGGSVFEELNHEAEAEKILDLLEIEDEAREIAKGLDLEDLQNVGHKIWGHRADKLSAPELKRDVRLYARNYPEDFLELFDNVDKDIEAVLSRALSGKFISWRKNNTELFWNLKEDKSMITRVKKGDDPVKSVCKFFTTNQGIEVYETLKELIKE